MRALRRSLAVTAVVFAIATTGAAAGPSMAASAATAAPASAATASPAAAVQAAAHLAATHAVTDLALASPAAATLKTVLKPYGGKWCARADMGGQLQVYLTGSHATRGHLVWNAANACKKGTKYPLNVWVQFILKRHTASLIYGRVISGNQDGLKLLPKGMRIAFKDRPGSGHIVIAPPHIQTARACRRPSAQFCTTPAPGATSSRLAWALAA